MLHYRYIYNDILFTVSHQSENLYQVGTFSNWDKWEAFKLIKTDNIHTLRKNRKVFNKLATSGFIEYYLWDDEKQAAVPFNIDYPVGYYFNNQHNGNFNYLLLPENVSADELMLIAK